MGEPVSLPCQVNDKHLLEKVQKKKTALAVRATGNIILGVCGVGGAVLETLHKPHCNEPALFMVPRCSVWGAQNHPHLSLSPLAPHRYGQTSQTVRRTPSTLQSWRASFWTTCHGHQWLSLAPRVPCWLAGVALPGIIEVTETAPLHRDASLQGTDDPWFWVGREHPSVPSEYPTDAVAHVLLLHLTQGCRISPSAS